MNIKDMIDKSLSDWHEQQPSQEDLVPRFEKIQTQQEPEADDEQPESQQGSGGLGAETEEATDAEPLSPIQMSDEAFEPMETIDTASEPTVRDTEEFTTDEKMVGEEMESLTIPDDEPVAKQEWPSDDGGDDDELDQKIEVDGINNELMESLIIQSDEPAAEQDWSEPSTDSNEELDQKLDIDEIDNSRASLEYPSWPEQEQPTQQAIDFGDDQPPAGIDAINPLEDQSPSEIDPLQTESDDSEPPLSLGEIEQPNEPRIESAIQPELQAPESPRAAEFQGEPRPRSERQAPVSQATQSDEEPVTQEDSLVGEDGFDEDMPKIPAINLSEDDTPIRQEMARSLPAAKASGVSVPTKDKTKPSFDMNVNVSLDESVAEQIVEQISPHIDRIVSTIKNQVEDMISTRETQVALMGIE